MNTYGCPTLCATDHCGPQAPVQAPAQAPQTLVDPEPFTEGERRTYDAVLAFLDAFPEAAASRTRDEGRGMAYAAQQARQAIVTLRDGG